MTDPKSGHGPTDEGRGRKGTSADRSSEVDRSGSGQPGGGKLGKQQTAPDGGQTGKPGQAASAQPGSGSSGGHGGGAGGKH